MERDMQVEMRAIGSIRPYENNPRHNDAAVDAVAASIREFGWRVPIVCDEQLVVICGHTRLKAAHKLGLTEVPVHIAVGLTPAQARAFRLADNQTAALSQWDDDKLPIELAALQEEGFDLALTGFDADKLLRLLDSGSNAGQCDPDAIPEPPDEAITKPGDLWLLGKHRLLCADSSKAEDVDRLLDGAQIHLVNTDPPYNVKVEPRSNNAIAAGLSSFSGTTHHQKLDVDRHPEKAQPTTKKLRAKDRPLANDFVCDEEFERLLQAWFGNMARALQAGRCFYIWGGYANLGNYPPVLKANGLYFSQGIVWDKEHPVLTRKDFMGVRDRVLWVERGGGPPVLRAEQRHRPLARQEGQSAEHGPFDPKASRVSDQRYPVFIPARRERPRPVRWQRQHADRCRAGRTQGVPHGVGPVVLRCDSPEIRILCRHEGRARRVTAPETSHGLSRTVRSRSANGVESP
jgi:ParB-like chromosome segregation protein Spo0J